MLIILHKIKTQTCSLIIGTVLLLTPLANVNAADDTIIDSQNDENIIVFSTEQPPMFTEPPSDKDVAVTIIPETPVPPQDTPTPIPEPIPDEPTGEVTIEREKMNHAIKPGEDFSFTLVFTNKFTNVDTTHVKLSLDLPSGIQYTKDWEKETLNLKDISPLCTQKQKITLTSNKDLSDQTVAKIKATVAYKYYLNDKLTDGKSEETLLLPVSGGKDTSSQEDTYNTTPSQDIPDSYGASSSSGSSPTERQAIDPITPNIMVKRFTYKKDLKAGEEFNLELEFVNTSKKIAAENAIVTINPGESIHIADDFSSFYIERLNPGETITKTIKMRTLPDGKPEGGEIGLETKYEYIKGTERTQASITDKLGIAFEQTDRFSIGDIQLENEITANEETTVSLPFVNKGKIPVYNLEARIETSANCQDTYKYLGNVESGTSGTADFFVTPQQAGEEKIKITLSYEDAQTRVKQEIREIVLKAQEPISDNFDLDGMGTDTTADEETTGFSHKLFGSIYIKLGAAAIIILISSLLWKHAKKKKKQSEEVEL